jgi:LysM repeat protein
LIILGLVFSLPACGPKATPVEEVTPTPAPPTPTPVLSTPTPLSTPREAIQQTVYEVQAGDTLSKIAKRYGVTVGEIVEANNISDPNLIWVGQKLIIPTGIEPAPTPLSQTPTVSDLRKCPITVLEIDPASIQQVPQIQQYLDTLKQSEVTMGFPTTDVRIGDAVVADFDCDDHSDVLVLFLKKAWDPLCGDGELALFKFGTWEIKQHLPLPMFLEGKINLMDMTGDSLPEIMLMGSSGAGGNTKFQALHVLSAHPLRDISPKEVSPEGKPFVKYAWGQIDVSDMNSNGIPDIAYTELLWPEGIARVDAFSGKPEVYEWDARQRQFSEIELSTDTLVLFALRALSEVDQKGFSAQARAIAIQALREEFGPSIMSEALRVYDRTREREDEIRAILLRPDTDLRTGIMDVGALLGVSDLAILYPLVSSIMADEFVVALNGELRRFREVENEILSAAIMELFPDTRPNPVIATAVDILADYKGVPLTGEEKYFISVVLTYTGNQVLSATTDKKIRIGERAVYVKELSDGSTIYIPTLTDQESQEVADLMKTAYAVYKQGTSLEFLVDLLEGKEGVDLLSVYSELDTEKVNRTLEEVDRVLRAFDGSSLAVDIMNLLGARNPSVGTKRLEGLFSHR